MKLLLRRTEPWLRALVGTSVLAVGCALALSARASERDPDPEVGPRIDAGHPSLAAGRLRRTSPVGGYLDVHRPLDVVEERLLEGYRDAPRGPANPRQGVANRDYVDHGRSRMPFDPRPRPVRRP